MDKVESGKKHVPTIIKAKEINKFELTDEEIKYFTDIIINQIVNPEKKIQVVANEW